jgi:tyrosinase
MSADTPDTSREYTVFLRAPQYAYKLLSYWNWAESAITGLSNHPAFDGSATSMSGNGAPIANQGNVDIVIPGFPTLSFPSGTGGGCVTSGPFKDHKVNLGPGGLVVPNNAPPADNRPNPLEYNPRCLKRDLSDHVNKRYANATGIVHLILANQHTLGFQTELEGPPGIDLGVHVSSSLPILHLLMLPNLSMIDH